MSEKQQVDPNEILSLPDNPNFTVASEEHPHENQDSYIYLPEKGLFGVFDGIGGHAKGRDASQKAKEIIHNRLGNLSSNLTVREVINHVDKSLKAAHDEIKNLSPQADIGSTGSVVYLCEEDGRKIAVIGNVGDSRVYRFRNGELTPLTVDDSFGSHGQTYEKALELQNRLAEVETEEDYQKLEGTEQALYNYSNYLTQALGKKEGGSFKTVRPRIWVEELEPGDKIFVCSDGISDNLSLKEIQAIFNDSVHDSSETTSRRFIDEAIDRSHSGRKRSKLDDMTALVIDAYPIEKDPYYVEGRVVYLPGAEDTIQRGKVLNNGGNTLELLIDGEKKSCTLEEAKKWNKPADEYYRTVSRSEDVSLDGINNFAELMSLIEARQGWTGSDEETFYRPEKLLERINEAIKSQKYVNEHLKPRGRLASLVNGVFGKKQEPEAKEPPFMRLIPQANGLREKVKQLLATIK